MMKVIILKKYTARELAKLPKHLRHHALKGLMVKHKIMQRRY